MPSVADAFGVPDPKVAPPEAPHGGISLHQAMGISDAPQKPVPRYQNSHNALLDKVSSTVKAVGKGIQNFGNAYHEEMGREIRSSLAQAKAEGKNFLAPNTGSVAGDIGSGLMSIINGVFDVGQAVISPAWAIPETVVGHPGEDLIDIIDAKSGSKFYRVKNPDGTTRMVDSTPEAAKEAWQMLLNAAAMFVGEKPGIEHGKVPGDSPGIPKGPSTDVPISPEERAIVDKLSVNRKPGKSIKDMIPKPTKEEIAANEKQQKEIEDKLRAHRVETAFDELAVKDPKNAHHIAEQIASVHPELGDKMKARVEDKVGMSEEEQVITGRDSARAQRPDVIDIVFPPGTILPEHRAGHASAAPDSQKGLYNLPYKGYEFEGHLTQDGILYTFNGNSQKASIQSPTHGKEFTASIYDKKTGSKIQQKFSKIHEALSWAKDKLEEDPLQQQPFHDEDFVSADDVTDTYKKMDRDNWRAKLAKLKEKPGLKFGGPHDAPWKLYDKKEHMVWQFYEKKNAEEMAKSWPEMSIIHGPDGDQLGQLNVDELKTTRHVSEYVKSHSTAENRELMEKQPVLENPKFIEWFGDSKAVDKNGDPQVYYHGTNQDIEEFIPGEQGQAIFGSPDPHFASAFAAEEKAGKKGDPVLYPVYMKAERPFDYRDRTQVAALVRRLKRNNPDHYDLPELTNQIIAGDWSAIEGKRVQEAIRQMGHDGYFTREGGKTNLAVYDAKQVKSAIGNSGEFSREDPRIHASEETHEPPTGLWHNLQTNHESLFKNLKNSGPISGKVLLDHFLESLSRKGLSSRSQFQKALLQKLRKAVGAVSIKVVDKLDHVIDGRRVKVDGMYYGDHTIEVVNNSRTAQVLIHELVHAATVNFIDKYPDHALTKEMHRLFAVAKARLAHSQLEHFASEREGMAEVPYGMKDTYEFVAEALSNRDFQRWLMSSERFASSGEKLKNLWNKFATLVQRMLGLEDKQSSLLHNVMEVSEQMIDERGKQMQSPAPPNMIASGLREGMRDVHASAGNEARKNVAIGKLIEWNRDLIRTFNPEALGKNAENAASIIARRSSELAHKDATYGGKNSMERKSFWNRRKEGDNIGFMIDYESGKKFSDPKVQEFADGMRRWTQDIYRQDMRTGFKYDPLDHYMMHIFETGPKIPLEEFLQHKFGSKWKDPAFIKDRGYRMYKEAIDAGYKPKFTNPEDIMLSRQHASDVAEMQTNILDDLSKWGSAVEAVKDEAPPLGFGTQRRSPTGKLYWVHRDAAAVLHNAFDTFSLWNTNNLAGSIFRGGMALKNQLIPIRLASLFHVMHIALALDNATGFMHGAKLLLSGGSAASRGSGIAKLLNALIPLKAPFFDNPRAGSRLMRAYKGEIDPGKLTQSDVQAMQYMEEGGFVPYMDKHWRSNATQAFKQALEKHQLTAAFRLPGAIIHAISKPIFEMWIPSLKTAAYLNGVKTELKLNPKLVHDDNARQLAFRRIAKHVDDRYGEMAYNNLFWPRWIKDLFVLNTLSLGWQKGLISQFGGAPLDLLKTPFRGNPMEQMRKGEMDKMLWVAGYTGMAMGYSGLVSYSLSGQFPTGMDWLSPRNGETNSDGTPGRLSTPFFTREFASIYKHMQTEGVVDTVHDVVASKGSGMVGLATEAVTGVNEMHQEIRDPNGTTVQKVGQTLHTLLRDNEPIAVQQSGDTTRTKVGAALGFTKAPQYVTDTPAVAAIKHAYREYHAPGKTSYERAQYSAAAKRVRELYKNDDPEAGQALDDLHEKYQLTTKQIKSLTRSVERGEDMDTFLFSQLSLPEQKRILDNPKTTDEEREKYLEHAHKQLRATYESPSN